MLRKRKLLECNNESQENAFNLSISDLMAGFLSIFILAVCYFMMNLGQVKEQYEGNQALRSEMLIEIQKEMDTKGIEVQISIDQGVIHLPEEYLFEEAKADITPEGQEKIHVLSKALHYILSQKKYADAVETIFIEGHTDNIPIENEEFYSNWELSTQRAINTWKLIQSDAAELGPFEEEDTEFMKNNKGEPFFACSGFAATRPLNENATPEERQANRRIDLRFTMMPPKDAAKR